MIQHIPTLHLSVRVPWHDSGWNGKMCKCPRDNGSCMILERINQDKNPDFEEQHSERWLHELEKEELPPCIGEKVTFMSKHDINKKASHPYAYHKSNAEFYAHYQSTDVKYPGYSFSVVPYNWMIKDKKTNTSEIAENFGLDFDAGREPKLSFENNWVQEFHNQKSLLDAFIKPIIPGDSLVFIYAKNIPHIDTTERILIGVGNISKIGNLTEYKYSSDKKDNAFRSTLWERPVFHTIRENFEDGFLLPYQEMVEFLDAGNVINVSDYVAFAPSFAEFSFGSEWVSNDTAIESLLILKEKLQKFEQLLQGKNYAKQISWIDNQLSKIWKLRGPFPGLGAVLTGLRIEGGNFIAWELDKIIRNEITGEVDKDPWELVEKLMNGEKNLVESKHLKGINNTIRATWKSFDSDEKEFFKLISRINLNNDQVAEIIDFDEHAKIEVLENPYILYEITRDLNLGFSPGLIDKIFFGSNNFLEKFPLSHHTSVESALDQKRIRAFGVQILEAASSEGNSLLADFQLATRFDELPVDPPCTPSIRNLLAIQDFLDDEIKIHKIENGKGEYYFKLWRLQEVKEIINTFVRKRTNTQINPAVNEDWLGIVNSELGEIKKSNPAWFQDFELEARKEKADALKTLSNNRLSVLIGPAGTGKTTLLNIFCNLPHIASGTILKLAPTGKARVNMGKDAQTLAQFLIRSERYDGYTGNYYVLPDAKKAAYDTVIVDECSMITEEQLASLIDSLSSVKRFILVGDYRQLPPIGTGRPFVDIYQYLKNENKAVSVLYKQFRQYSDNNVPAEPKERLDIRLARWFSDDEIRKNDEDIFQEISANKEGKWRNIRFVEWFNTKDLEEKIKEISNQEIYKLLGNDATNDFTKNFELSIGGIPNGDYINFGLASAQGAENWQLITPNRTQGYGTKVLNQVYHKHYREKMIAKVNGMPNYNRTLPNPVGDDGMVYGDKVINISNVKWSSIYPKTDDATKYIANGEIGIHIGAVGNAYQTTGKVQVVFSSQPKYSYQFYESHFGEDGKVNMELAYSITIHKSQGSGFRTVIFVLPNPCPILSRELLYTALTRQKDRIIILHQGDFQDFKRFIRDEFSESGKRFTDLFYQPLIKTYNNKNYDSNYIQVSENGEFMISKSEVIIADKLKHYKIPYAYEYPLKDDSGVVIHPDFTIEDADTGIIYYWEHLGMLNNDNYRSKWTRKKEFYVRNKIFEIDDERPSNQRLIITRDKPDGGIDSQQIKNLIDKILIN